MELPNIGAIEHITVDGLQIRVARTGRNDGLPILMLSPWPESMFAFRDVLPSIQDLGPIVIVDLPGFGRSQGRLDLMAPKAQAEFIIKLAVHLGLSRVHAIAPDIGTPTILYAALQQPNLFESIVVGAGATQVDLTGELLRGMIDSPVGFYGEMDGGDVVLQILGAFLKPAAPEAVLEDYRLAAAGCRLEDQVNFVRAYKDQLPALMDQVRTIDVPVMVLCGKTDPFVPPSDGELLSGKLRHSAYTALDGGHFVWEQCPEAYGAHLRKWIDGAHKLH